MSATSTPASSSDNQVTIGIDFGTTGCSVGVLPESGTPDIIANEEGNRTTSSIIAFTHEELLIGGESALAQWVNNAKNTVFHVFKKCLGAAPTSEEALQQLAKQHGWQCRLVLLPADEEAGSEAEVGVEVEYKGQTKRYSMVQMARLMLGKMKSIAERYVGKTCTRAVISVPVSFDEKQRNALKKAAQDAGLQVMQLLNDPTAVAIANGLDMPQQAAQAQQQKPATPAAASAASPSSDSTPVTPTNDSLQELDSNQEKLILVLDIGGIDSRAALLSSDAGVLQILHNATLHGIGGTSFDNKVVDHCVQEFKKKSGGADITQNVKSLNRLRIACEKAKITLSTSQTAAISCDGLFEGIDYSTQITRARFEMMISSLLNQCTTGLVQQLLSEAGVDKSRVGTVLLAGASCTMPKVEQLITDIFGQNNVVIRKSINPAEVVACGCTIQAATFASSKNADRRAGEIAAAAATPAAAGTSEEESMLQIDVTPFSIGIETAQGLMFPIVKRDTKLPVHSEKLVCATNRDGQTSLLLKVLEGERMLAKDCRELGYIVFSNITPAPRGQAKVELVFNIDINGVLTVTATDVLSAKEQTLQIQPAQVESTDETKSPAEAIKKQVDEEVRNAKSKQQEDLAFRQVVEARQALEDYVFEIRKREKLMAIEGVTALTDNTLKWLDQNKDYAITNKDAFVAKHHEVHQQLATLRKAASTQSA